jgi:hypothetical protein
MTEARVERVYEDRVAAREFLAQAELFVADADAATLRSPSRALSSTTPRCARAFVASSS